MSSPLSLCRFSSADIISVVVFSSCSRCPCTFATVSSQADHNIYGCLIFHQILLLWLLCQEMNCFIRRRSVDWKWFVNVKAGWEFNVVNISDANGEVKKCQKSWNEMESDVNGGCLTHVFERVTGLPIWFWSLGMKVTTIYGWNETFLREMKVNHHF